MTSTHQIYITWSDICALWESSQYVIHTNNCNLQKRLVIWSFSVFFVLTFIRCLTTIKVNDLFGCHTLMLTIHTNISYIIISHSVQYLLKSDEKCLWRNVNISCYHFVLCCHMMQLLQHQKCWFIFVTKQLQAENLNGLWPSYVIWQHNTVSTLAQVRACCLTAPSHYPNQCWLLVNGDL